MTDLPGPIGLVGSGEFLACSDVIDGALLERVSRRGNRAVIIPTAAGQEGPTSVGSWLRKGTKHFERLGLEPVPLPIVDRLGANDAENAAMIDDASIIYFSGGNPSYVIESMRDTLVWAAVLTAWRSDAALAGCSAGAMMMGSVTASPRQSGLIDALGVFDRLCVIPHFDRFDSFRPGMTESIVAAVGNDTSLVGIDEETGLVIHGGQSFVIGRRQVWSISKEGRTGWAHGEATTLDLRTV